MTQIMATKSMDTEGITLEASLSQMAGGSSRILDINEELAVGIEFEDRLMEVELHNVTLDYLTSVHKDNLGIMESMAVDWWN